MPIFIIGVDGTACFAQIIYTYYDNAKYAPFDQIAYRKELRDRLMKISGMRKEVGSAAKEPWFDLIILNEPQAFDLFVETFEWMIHAIDQFANTHTGQR